MTAAPQNFQQTTDELRRKAALFREGTKRIYDGQGNRADMWYFELWHFLGDVQAALTVPASAPVVTLPRREQLARAIAGKIGCEVDCQSDPSGCGCSDDAADVVMALYSAAALSQSPATEPTRADFERVFQDACDEAGCAYDNEALLEAIASLKLQVKTYRDTNHVLRETLRVVRAEWQPIETAPRDGTVILATWADSWDDVGTVSYHVHIEAMCHENGIWYYAYDGDSHTRAPTHWLPLPAAPALSQAPVTDGAELPRNSRPGFWTHDDEAAKDVGHLYYFAPVNRASPPYKTQRHVTAIIDIAADGTLAGVELINDMPPPPGASHD